MARNRIPSARIKSAPVESKPALTPEEIAESWRTYQAYKRGSYLDKLAERRDRAREQLDEDLELIKRNPGNTLAWGTGLCENAATFETLSGIVAYLDAGETIENVCKRLRADLLRNAMHPQWNSNPTTMAYNTCKQSAVAKEVEDMSTFCEATIPS